ncbi:hypothetical protein ACLOJK_011285 [Asimina triloba]
MNRVKIFFTLASISKIRNFLSPTVCKEPLLLIQQIQDPLPKEVPQVTKDILLRLLGVLHQINYGECDLSFHQQGLPASRFIYPVPPDVKEFRLPALYRIRQILDHFVIVVSHQCLVLTSSELFLTNRANHMVWFIRSSDHWTNRETAQSII